MKRSRTAGVQYREKKRLPIPVYGRYSPPVREPQLNDFALLKSRILQQYPYLKHGIFLQHHT
jgi:hypothetical protein